MYYVEGHSREQLIMFPESLDDYVVRNSLVCFIEEFVNGLDLVKLGFKYSTPTVLGRHSYSPGDLLKLYLYGYHNYIRSSRRLEKETQRNVEVMWLLRKLTPDDKTIANFRKDNRKAMKKVFREFVIICRDLGLISGEILGVDGSKFRAQNSKDNNFSAKKLREKIERIDKQTETYLSEMDNNDDGEPPEAKLSVEEMNNKIEELKGRREKHEANLQKLEESGESQLSLTDPESRLMKDKGRSDVCYNVQTVVDSKNKMIVEYDVTNHENDSNLLYEMSKSAKDSLGLKNPTILADSGYHDCNEIKKCVDDGMTVFLPHRSFPGGKNGLPLAGYHKEDFTYISERNVYVCPCGFELTYAGIEKRPDKLVKVYKCSDFKECSGCSNCTGSKTGRKVRRWIHEEILEEMADRVSNNPAMMKKRKEICEHPFGTLKRGFGFGHFLTRGKEKTNAEMGLSALVYNIKRAIKILGFEALIEHLKTLRARLKTSINPLLTNEFCLKAS